MNRGRKRMYGGAACELPRFAIGKRNLEQVCATGPVRGEDERAVVRCERALQEVSGMVDRRMVRHLVDDSAGDRITEGVGHYSWKIAWLVSSRRGSSAAIT